MIHLKRNLLNQSKETNIYSKLEQSNTISQLILFVCKVVHVLSIDNKFSTLARELLSRGIVSFYVPQILINFDDLLIHQSISSTNERLALSRTILLPNRKYRPVCAPVQEFINNFSSKQLGMLWPLLSQITTTGDELVVGIHNHASTSFETAKLMCKSV